MQAWINLIMIGAVIGVANIVPGISGGTMAVILNVFDKLIFSISNFRKEPKKSIYFLLPVLIGAGLGVVIFSFIIKYLLENYPLQVNYFFVGLIVGSIPLIFSKVETIKKQTFPKLIFFVLGIALMVVFELFNIQKNTGLIQNFSPIIIFVDCIIAAIAMLLPGVSGSLVLVILGPYFTIINAISEFNLIVLMPTGLGTVIGLLLGSKIIAICLKNYSGITFAFISGLVIGSIYTILSKVSFIFNLEGLIAVICLIMGLAIAYSFGKKA